MQKWRYTCKSEIQKFIAILIAMGIVHFPKMRLNNADQTTKTDRFTKVRPLDDLIFGKFQMTITPGESIVTDESMVPWRGRLFFRQYLPGKSHKYGIKCYKLCRPESYTYNLQVYAGKTETQKGKRVGHGHEVVLQCRTVERGQNIVH
ncbi:hypothetical protein J437_LFUL011707 [Ladona fulva]|uniref:PiggyBac transposable element-derived protein domain-containing protein n=1 Tax=Ladona fulva TaxID=123851 RepID=A0A8K0KRF4_LADFU|nr:hypothetical protein J437_LFUL011707 [Ladona fulva]